jgi:uncharacterized membrane protein
VLIGSERTLEQDAGFGFRELEDIAVKALSPAINDPVTAAHAIGHVGDLLTRLPTGRHLARGCGGDRSGDRPRSGLRLLPGAGLRPDPAVRQGEPTVLVALLRMPRDVAVAARDEKQREQIAGQAGLVVEAAAASLLPSEHESVRDMERRVRAALEGDDLAAYLDRAGETRSI